MNTTLTPLQVNRYRNDGFLVFPKLLDAAEVKALKAAVLIAMEDTKKRVVPGVGAYYDAVWTRRVNLWRVNDAIRRCLCNRELGDMLCRLAKVGGLRIWHDQALIKEPHANPTAWHVDGANWSFHSRDAISIWIALENVTPGNGCMWFVPGSHRLTRFDTAGRDGVIGENLGGLFEIYPELAAVETVPAPMQAGDCSFHNGMTAHGAGANMTLRRRIAMTCAYMPVESTFNGTQNVLPDDYVKTLRVGDVLNNDAFNPLVDGH